MPSLSLDPSQSVRRGRSSSTTDESEGFVPPMRRDTRVLLSHPDRPSTRERSLRKTSRWRRPGIIWADRVDDRRERCCSRVFDRALKIRSQPSDFQAGVGRGRSQGLRSVHASKPLEREDRAVPAGDDVMAAARLHAPHPHIRRPEPRRIRRLVVRLDLALALRRDAGVVVLDLAGRRLRRPSRECPP